MWMFVLIVGIFSINLYVTRCAFVRSDCCVGLLLIGEEAEETKCGEPFISSSLWQARGGKFHSAYELRSKAFSVFDPCVAMWSNVPGLDIVEGAF